ncbi:SWIM zinc finger family protein [Haloplanus natans]|uniref:SWIM zinc finger family protein n=1 Tax=Haloplanus natans TaxID=376171 RepID=UPI0012FACFCA|nr:SWIM zinc finger family protein [Haloplanus natans]
MSIDDAAEVSPSVTTLDDRDARALSECMTVLPEGADIYTVVGENGGTYTVDADAGRCTCPDAEYRDANCKHRRRVAFATGERPIPAWVDTDAVDPQLGAHVDGPRWECDHGRTHCAESAGARDDAVRCSDCTAEVVADGGVIEAGDEGELLDEDDDGVVDLAEVTGDAEPERPEDCDCGDWNAGLGLPCWPCYREGFGTPASAGGEGADA